MFQFLGDFLKNEVNYMLQKKSIQVHEKKFSVRLKKKSNQSKNVNVTWS